MLHNFIPALKGYYLNIMALNANHYKNTSFFSISFSKEANRKLESNLCDLEYKDYFAKFNSERLKKCVFIEDFGDIAPRNAFKLDKKGDKNNACFDTAFHKLVPKYNLPITHKIPILLRTKGFKQQSRKHQRRLLIKQAKENRYYNKITKADLENSSQVKIEKSALSTVVNESTISNNIWLYLQIKNETLSKDDQGSFVDRTSDYMKYLHENKKDIAKWLEFIEYQSRAQHFSLDKSSSMESTSGAQGESLEFSTMSMYQRKCSIFERAIKENPDSFRLKLELLKYKASSIEITNLIDSIDKLETEFFSLLVDESVRANRNKLNKHEQRTHVNNLFEVWFELIKFLIDSNSININLNRIRSVFLKCFDYFTNSENNSIINANKNKEFFLINLIELVDFYCTFMAQSGYVEKSIALYQALIDFNFCIVPSNKNSKHNNMSEIERKALFELYWDMGLPKFGEAHSTGWLNCLESREKIERTLVESEERIKNSLNRYDEQLEKIETRLLDCKSLRVEFRWHELERLRSMLNWYPFYARSSLGESSDDIADQDRLVSFEDDLRHFLFDLNSIKEDSKFSSSFNESQNRVEHIKFILFCKFLKHLNIISIDEETIDIKFSLDENEQPLTRLSEDANYANYLNEKLTLANENSLSPTDREEIAFAGTINFLKNLLNNLFNFDESSVYKNNIHDDPIEKQRLLDTLKLVCINTIDFIRNCLSQLVGSFSTLKYKTFAIILKWKFELLLLDLLSSNEIKSSQSLNRVHICEDETNQKYFDAETVKQNLLNQVKNDLSIPENRANFYMWKQYAILKWLLNHERYSSVSSSSSSSRKSIVVNLKETRKIFDTLFKMGSSDDCLTSLQACLDIYSLCIDYIALELGLFYRQFDVLNSSFRANELSVGFSTMQVQHGFFDLTQLNLKLASSTSENKNLKQQLIELLAKNCLNRSNIEMNKSKSKATFKIEMSESTRILLLKKDFLNEYEQLKVEVGASINDQKVNSTSRFAGEHLLEKKLCLYHQIYSLFLLLIEDIERLFELNESLLKESIFYAHKSKLIEFYLTILNYLHFQENRITTFMYKSKLFLIIRSLFSSLNDYNFSSFNNKSLIRLLMLSLTRYKLNNTSAFCSQILENNDIDLLMIEMGTKLYNNRIKSHSDSYSIIWLSLIYTYFYRLHRAISSIESSSLIHGSHVDEKSIMASNLGIHHQIRRLLQQALRMNSKSIQLWLHFLKFEVNLINNRAKLELNLEDSKRKLLYIYYQSVRSMPYCKVN
jgi:hypothetical protein